MSLLGYYVMSSACTANVNAQIQCANLADHMGGFLQAHLLWIILFGAIWVVIAVCALVQEFTDRKR